MTLNLAFAPLAALDTSGWTFLDNLEFSGLGILIVMLALTVLWLLCEATGFVFKRLDARQAAHAAAKEAAAPAPAPQPAAAAVAAASPAVAEDAVPVVVLAAAVAAVIDQPHRVVEIRPSSPVWALEGRRQVLGSHKLPR